MQNFHPPMVHGVVMTGSDESERKTSVLVEERFAGMKPLTMVSSWTFVDV